MKHMGLRRAHVIAIGEDARDRLATGRGSRGRSFNYQALLADRRALDPPDAGGDADPADDVGHSSAAPAPAPDGAPEPVAPDDGPAPGGGRPPLLEDRALRLRLAQAAQPVVEAACEQQERLRLLLDQLARETGMFCCDPAIAQGGYWDVELPLDQQVAPHTTLYLSLSPFILHLQFDTTDRATRELLQGFGATLERDLDRVLRAWGNAREVRLSVR